MSRPSRQRRNKRRLDAYRAAKRAAQAAAEEQRLTDQLRAMAPAVDYDHRRSVVKCAANDCTIEIEGWHSRLVCESCLDKFDRALRVEMAKTLKREPTEKEVDDLISLALTRRPN